VETVPEEKESGNKKKNTEETAPVTEPEKAEAAEATEPEKSEKENNAGETSATEETGEAAEETVEPTVEETVETVPQETAPAETIPEETEPVLINGKPLQEYQINRDGYYDETLGENITVEYQTRSFETKVQKFSGWAAQIIQHEIDHLNGIII